MEAKRNCGSESTDAPTVYANLPRPILASTSNVPETYFKNTIKLIIFHIIYASCLVLRLIETSCKKVNYFASCLDFGEFFKYNKIYSKCY
jgi:hypothetical protein